MEHLEEYTTQSLWPVFDGISQHASYNGQDMFKQIILLAEPAYILNSITSATVMHSAHNPLAQGYISSRVVLSG